MANENKLLLRFIGPEDFGVFWPLRLLALRESPEAFGASYEESKKLPPEEAVKRLSPADGGFIVGAFAPDLVGITGFARQGGLKGRHKGTIWGVYVAPNARGQGVARALMERVLAQCRTIADLEEVNLAVVTTNEAARALYKSLGFETYGVEPRAIKIDNNYFDEELMVLRLR